MPEISRQIRSSASLTFRPKASWDRERAVNRTNWTNLQVICYVIRCLLATSFVIVGSALNRSDARAQETDIIPTNESQTPKVEEPAPVDPEVARKLRSPYDTYMTFRKAADGNVDEAILTLDVSEHNNDVISAKKSDWVFKLNEILNRMVFEDELLNLPSDPDFDDSYFLGEDVTGFSGTDQEDAEKIIISQSPDGLWRFSANTVAQIEEIYDRWDSRDVISGSVVADALSAEDSSSSEVPVSVQIKRLFPERLHEQHLLLPDYQWICLALLVVAGVIADRLVCFLLHHIAAIWLKFITKTAEDMKAEKRVWKPVGLLVQGIIWYSGARLFLPANVLEVLLAALKFFAIFAALWTSWRLVDLLAHFLEKKAAKTATRFDDLLVPLFSQSVKIICVCVGFIVFAQTYNLPLTGLIGGLGIGGMALALASKDAVSNFFGSFTILADRPFEIGDWIVTEGIEGTVETVGFRSSRIRTFYNSIITLPNSRLTTAIVDNMGRRRFRRIRTMLSVQYNTSPDQINAFCEGVRELIRRHPYTRKDYYQVYLNQFSESSLDILLYCFIECPDWSVELRERHRLFLDIIALAGRLGVSFAFPTRTLHMFQEQSAERRSAEPLDNAMLAGRQQAAEVAGPLSPPDKRPGPVRFEGPSEL